MGRKKIESISLDDLANSRTQLVSDVEQPIGLAIWDTQVSSGIDQQDTTPTSILYYADQVQECLVAFNLRTNEKNIIKNNVPYIEQLKLYQRPQFQSYSDGGFNNPCLTNNGGCHQICLPSKTSPQGRVCRCSNGLELQQQDSVSCRPYKNFIFFATDSIIRAMPFGGNYDGQNYKEALPKITGVNMKTFDFDYKRGVIYWIEDGSLVKSLMLNSSWSSRLG